MLVFPSQDPLYCPLAAQLFKECREVPMSFLSRISQTQSMFFFVQQFSLFWNQLSHFKDHVYSKSSLLKWNQRCYFLKRSFKNQAFCLKIQHILFKIYSPLIIMYFESRNWPIVRLQWLFSWFFVSILDSDFWVYLLMVCDEVTCLWIWKNKMPKSNLRLYQERLFFLTFILSACIITSSLIHEATTFMEKLFKFWSAIYRFKLLTWSKKIFRST